MTLERDRENRRQEALERHHWLSRLFREDRLAFERERKRMIEETIESADDVEMRGRLMSLQDDWNRRMRGAGSCHNRLVLAKAFFWDHFHRVWHPGIEKANRELRRLAD